MINARMVFYLILIIYYRHAFFCWEYFFQTSNKSSETLLTHLISFSNIQYYYINSQLVYVYYSMSNLKKLETLVMSKNNFSKGLPDVITSMASLKKLDISGCKLPTLPERLVKRRFA